MPEAEAVQQTNGAASPPVDGLQDTIDRMSEATEDASAWSLANGSQEPEAPKPEPEPIEEPGKQAAKAPEASKEVDLSKGFSDEELATPEGVKAAADKVRAGFMQAQERWREVDEAHTSLTRREKKFKDKLEGWKSERETITTQWKGIQTDLQALSRGDAATALNALGRLRGMSGAQALEELTLTVVHNGKLPKKELTVEEFERRLEERESKWRQEREEEQKQARIAELHRDATAFRQRITAEKYPTIYKFASRDMGDVLGDLLEAHPDLEAKHGRRLDYDEVLGEIEAELAKDFGSPVSGSTERGTGTPQETRQAQSSPGQTLSPSLSATSASRRPTTAEENRRAAEDLVPDAWVRMGQGYE